MTEVIGEVLSEGVRAYSNMRREEARYAYLSGGSTKSADRPTPPAKSQELTVPSVELNNYVKRTEIGDEEKHVLVVEHSERIEKKFVPSPPPTAEEVAAEREHKRFMAKLYAGVASVAIVVFGTAVVLERRSANVRRLASSIEV